MDSGCRQADELPDDQALFFETRQGLVVLLGCAHAGVVNTVEYIRGLKPGRPFQAVIGGMHLHAASAERMRRTLEALDRFAIGLLVPAHCTGSLATTAMRRRFGDRCVAGLVGMRWTFDLRKKLTRKRQRENRRFRRNGRRLHVWLAREAGLKTGATGVWRGSRRRVKGRKREKPL
ncbi:MAG: MBL fold metallo-hydrolase [candidate division FCPU426 bacterium]